MKLPRDLSGEELVSRLRRYGYQVSHQTGSHIRLTAIASGKEHHITIPAHKELKVGTLSGILAEVAANLVTDRAKLAEELFG